MARVMQNDPLLPCIELVQDTVVSHAKPKLGSALQPLMGKPGEVLPHPVNFVLDRLLN